MNNALRLYTVGYSNRPFAHFLELLRAHGIKCVRDVRTVPESSHAPQYGSMSIQYQLRGADIEYRFDGDTLGGRPKDKRFYLPNGRVNFASLKTEPRFQQAIRALVATRDMPATALACTEADPLECPRFFLLARVLTASGVDVIHILRDGQAQPHAELEETMLERLGGAEPDLFSPREVRIQRGYEALERAYKHRWGASTAD